MKIPAGNEIPLVCALAAQWSGADLGKCLVEVSANRVCVSGHSPETTMGVLAKAAVVRRLIDDGNFALRDAMRVPGRRMRQFSAR